LAGAERQFGRLPNRRACSPSRPCLVERATSTWPNGPRRGLCGTAPARWRRRIRIAEREPDSLPDA